jgi:ArsR family transcriptional regulator, arsenate/arsenite/antimonite-responsive transcriptional repressor
MATELVSKKDLDFVTQAKLFKAFCDENRLHILEVLKQGEQCACNLLDTLTIGQSTLSHHMKILLESGVVSSRKDGKWVYYALSEEGCQLATDLLDLFLESAKNTEVGGGCVVTCQD